MHLSFALSPDPSCAPFLPAPGPSCSSLAFQPPEELAITLEAVRRAGITVVSLPLVNQWTQDRSHEGGRTPRWRGITLLHELRQVGSLLGIAAWLPGKCDCIII